MTKHFPFGLLMAALCFHPLWIRASEPGDWALLYVRNRAAVWGMKASDLEHLRIIDHYKSSHNQVTHVYMRQEIQGIPILNADIALHLDREGQVVVNHRRLVADLIGKSPSLEPSLSPVDAIRRAAKLVGIEGDIRPVVLTASKGPRQETRFEGGADFIDEILTALALEVSTDQSVVLVWQLILPTAFGHFHVRLDAGNGDLVGLNDWRRRESYRVFPLPFESPDDPGASQQVVVVPFHPDASPLGWHDDDGAVGPEHTETVGNNVVAQEDVDGDDGVGLRADGGVSLVFDFPWDPGLAPDAGDNQAAAIVNLFYWNNLLHDLHFLYGFDEAAGNFQEFDYSGMGMGGDRVSADAQDGSGTNNANFTTPPDGQPPRMQMFLFDDPIRDGSLDAGLIIHEYGHGITNRLTGGPSNVDCLPTFCLATLCVAVESGGMGEGWSDFWTLALTAKAGDTATQARGIATYALGEAPDGPGTRDYPYSTDMSVNPHTYRDVATVTHPPHEIGEIWCSALWDAYWVLVDAYGFDPDFYSGTGGNNLMLQLVMDGLKLQPCEPTFVDARDAILRADLLYQGGANICMLWEAFARRGLGVDADDRGDHLDLDVVEDFKVPFHCACGVALSSWPMGTTVQSLIPCIL